MRNFFLITLGKILSKSVQILNLGNGSTWPGHIALKVNKHFIRDLLRKSDMKIICIAGTNGKTTTATLIKTALEKNGRTVIQNSSGANLLNGIASTLLLQANNQAKLPYNFAIFEVDENALPLILKELAPDYLVLLNLFRDQLDRYGEVNTIIEKWKESIKNLSEKTTMIVNADDPQIAFLGIKSKKSVYFGLQSSQFGTDTVHHAADSVHCPKCGEKLAFTAIAFSHLGDWHCKKCGLKRPKIESEKFIVYPLSGLYNKYNTLAAAVVLKKVGLTDEERDAAFTDFHPAFGRQEIIQYKNKPLQIFLSKNPTSFNQSYATMRELGAKNLLLVLNDRIPDGRDVSWIWDVDLPAIDSFTTITIAGDRVYDMALRLKYELGSKTYESHVHTYENLTDAVEAGVEKLAPHETLFILPTYSAMLDVRKIVTGKKIL